MHVPDFQSLALGDHKNQRDSGSLMQTSPALLHVKDRDCERPETLSQTFPSQTRTNLPRTSFKGPPYTHDTDDSQAKEEEYFQYIEKDDDIPPSMVGPSVHSTSTQRQAKVIARWEPVSSSDDESDA